MLVFRATTSLHHSASAMLRFTTRRAWLATRVSVAVLALLLLCVPSALAQTLPDWARPSEPTPYYEADPEAVAPEFDPFFEEDDMLGPELPGAPPVVPVDGGLGLLALAGAGYAARRLRRSSSH